MFYLLATYSSTRSHSSRVVSTCFVNQLGVYQAPAHVSAVAATAAARGGGGSGGGQQQQGGGAVGRKGRLLQLLLTVFFGNCPRLRRQLRLPQQTAVDFRVSCFDTTAVRDLAWVCPVCLSVFEHEPARCTTCGSAERGGQKGGRAGGGREKRKR